MNGQAEPDVAKNEPGLFAGSGKKSFSPGLGAYLRPGKAGGAAAPVDAEIVSARAKDGAAKAGVEKPSAGLLALSLWLADALLLAVSGCLLWNGGTMPMILVAAAAFLLAAWCGCLGCWVAISSDNR